MLDIMMITFNMMHAYHVQLEPTVKMVTMSRLALNVQKITPLQKKVVQEDQTVTDVSFHF